MKTRLMNNLGLKILAFLAAGMLWLLVVNIDDPVTSATYQDVAVTVINQEVLAEEQQTFQIVDDTQTVDVTVTARRSVLNRIRQENITATADMRELTLKTQIPISISIEGYDYVDAEASPRNLQVRLEDEETKSFPIVPTTTGTVRDGYVLGDIQAVPENVSIRGPKSVVDQIDRVEASVNVSGLSQDAVLPSELVLYDEEGDEIDQSLLTNNLGDEGVSVSVELYQTKSVPIVFDTSRISAADGYEFVGITYEPEEIQISGSKDALDDISEINIPASALELSGLTKRTEQVVDISGYTPDNVSLADENAGSVAVTISVEKDGTRVFDVTPSSVIVNNLSEDLVLNYDQAEALEVHIRGPRESLDSLSLEKKVSIDLTDYTEAGSYTVPVAVELPEDCALETEVSIQIVLEEKE
ncbi:hypothetical protein FND36_06095 [Lachnospiraceae bacterium KGMB03038]|nr:hypothetical protein FND36_06095 [Lachnospiraceae bacterium KGMB03038]